MSGSRGERSDGVGDSATEQEPVTFVDKRKVDPETGDVRDVDPVVEPLAGTAAAPQPGSVDEEGLAEAEATVAPAQEQSLRSDQKAQSAELAERTADLQRLSAEYANYRRRITRDKQVDIEAAKASVVAELIGVVDDLERAKAHGDLETGPLKSVADKLAALLSKQGVSEFGTEGEAFDPTLHEAVQHEGDGHNPVIGTVMRKGYRMGERVLRHAMVAVTDAVADLASAGATPAGFTPIDPEVAPKAATDSGFDAESEQR